MTGVQATIDALVVAVCAAVGGGVVLTSDGTDIRKLASSITGPRIRAIVV